MESLTSSALTVVFGLAPSPADVLALAQACQHTLRAFRECANEICERRLPRDFPCAFLAPGVPTPTARPLIGAAPEERSAYEQWRWWGIASNRKLPASADVPTIPGIAAGVSARLNAVLRGLFLFRESGTAGGCAPATARKAFAEALLTARAEGLNGQALARSKRTYPGVGIRYEVIWWEPSGKGGGGGVTAHRDVGIKLYEPSYASDMCEGYGSEVDISPTSGHHCLVDPRVMPTMDMKPGFDHNTFWTSAFWLGHVGSCGVDAWDGEYKALARLASTYSAPVVRTCNACQRRSAKDDVTGAHGPLKACTACKAVHYCCKECQLHDWKAAGHKTLCPKLGAAANTAKKSG